MKRKPEKNYKRPKYAAGLAAMMLAGSMTGCTGSTAGEVQIDGGMDVPEDTRYVELAGDVAYVEETAEETIEETTEEAIEETMLAGDVAFVEETVEVTLDGDVAVAPEETCIPDIPPDTPGVFLVETETE